MYDIVCWKGEEPCIAYHVYYRTIQWIGQDNRGRIVGMQQASNSVAYITYHTQRHASAFTSANVERKVEHAAIFPH